jgi:hypothetical protein
VRADVEFVLPAALAFGAVGFFDRDLKVGAGFQYDLGDDEQDWELGGVFREERIKVGVGGKAHASFEWGTDKFLGAGLLESFQDLIADGEQPVPVQKTCALGCRKTLG